MRSKITLMKTILLCHQVRLLVWMNRYILMIFYVIFAGCWPMINYYETIFVTLQNTAVSLHLSSFSFISAQPTVTAPSDTSAAPSSPTASASHAWTAREGSSGCHPGAPAPSPAMSAAPACRDSTQSSSPKGRWGTSVCRSPRLTRMMVGHHLLLRLEMRCRRPGPSCSSSLALWRWPWAALPARATHTWGTSEGGSGLKVSSDMSH